MESSLPRFQQLRRTEPISNRTLIGTVVFMGLLQVVSSVAVVLHLTGHLQQVIIIQILMHRSLTLDYTVKMILKSMSFYSTKLYFV